MRTATAAALIVAALCASALAAPALEVDKTEWKIGKVPRGEARSTTFTLRNTGDEELAITQIRPSCKSCLGKLGGDAAIKPGESRPLEVTYKATDAYGEHAMSVTIHSNDPEHPLTRLKLSVEVVPQKDKPLLVISPPAVDMGVVEAGKPVRVDVTLTNEGDAPLEVRSIVPSAGCRLAGDISKDAIQPKGTVTIPLEVTPRSKGVVRESLGIESTDPDRPEAEVTIEGYAQEGALAVPSVAVTIAPVYAEGAIKEYIILNRTQQEVKVTTSRETFALSAGQSRVVSAAEAEGITVRLPR